MAAAARRTDRFPECVDRHMRRCAVQRGGRLIVVSNRLPLATEINDNNSRFTESAGGLVTALVPILRQSGGCWVGWPGCDYQDGLVQALEQWTSSQEYCLVPVFITASEYKG